MIKVWTIVVDDYLFVNGNVCFVRAHDEVTGSQHLYIGACCDSNTEQTDITNTINLGAKYEDDMLPFISNRIRWIQKL